MALSATTTIAHPVSDVTAVLANEEFQGHVSQLVGGVLESFDVNGNISDAFTATIVRSLPTTRLPEMVRKFVGERLTVTQVENWEAPAADGSRQSTITVKVAGAPVDVSAVQRLVPEAGGTRVDLEGTVKSSVPFLGSKIADAAEPMVAKALNLQASQAQAWLESH